MVAILIKWLQVRDLDCMYGTCTIHHWRYEYRLAVIQDHENFDLQGNVNKVLPENSFQA